MFHRFRASLVGSVALSVLLVACGGAPIESEDTPPQIEAEVSAPVPQIVRDDKFTYANYDEVQVSHLNLELTVDFDAKQLVGTATLDLEKLDPTATEVILDMRGLSISEVRTYTADIRDDGTVVDFTIGEEDPVLGQALTIPLSAEATTVEVDYSTSPEAEGLQWLSPEQTAGKEHPFLFSQAQPLNARTMAPLQDTPAVRMTYSASLEVPPALEALMSAEQVYKDEEGSFEFDMQQPIPSYLLAIAVGDFSFRAINDHIGVYAEDYILEASAEEFSETPLMEDANAALYGPYRWDRYDMIVLPPSFPFGGMENPRLSFLTPTLVAGDKSLTNVVAHELAHSWSGNLVTNANWRDAWLNEGFTSYVENRVMEALYGEDRAIMEQALALEDLKRDVAANPPELTHLKMPEDLAHPDDAFSNVSYVKGQFFLMFLEERFGRDAFDPFLKEYFDTYAFQAVTTELFLEYLDLKLRKANSDAVTDAEINAWVYGPGIPETAADPQSDAFDKVSAVIAEWTAGEIDASAINTNGWSTHEWLHFVNNLPEGMTDAQFDALDAAFAFTGTQNAETAFAWYMQAIVGDYDDAAPAIEDFLLTVGRGKFIYRLYAALDENGKGEWAREVYARARPGYHPIAQRRIDAILNG